MNGTTTHTVHPALEQLFAAATNHASVAMGQWTHGQVLLSMDQLHETGIESVAEVLGIGDDLLTMVVLGIEGDPGGLLILMFDDDNGRQLAATLMQREVSTEPEWSAIEQSSVMETGNILASAYLNELTRLTGKDLKPSPPTLVQDFGASVVQQALMMQAAESDQVLICQTRFEFNSQEVNWNVLIVPTQSLLRDMEKSLRGD